MKKVKINNSIFYSAIVLVILLFVVVGWYAFSSAGKMMCLEPGYCGSRCNRWKCTDTKTYTCPIGANYSCSSGVLSCMSCNESFVTKNYNVTLIAIGNQTANNTTVLSAIFYINGDSAMLTAGQKKTLSDNTIFGLTLLNLNYSLFYLQSPIETKSSSLTAPFPKSTTVNLKIGKTGGCGGTSFSCSNWYVPSCSADQKTLTCSLTNYYCDEKVGSNCTRAGTCLC